jgi:hypothetical protein
MSHEHKRVTHGQPSAGKTADDYDIRPGVPLPTNGGGDRVPPPGPIVYLDFGRRDPNVYIPPFAFLRTMLLIAWSAFRHPFSTTTIDMLSGECVQDHPAEG